VQEQAPQDSVGHLQAVAEEFLGYPVEKILRQKLM
jgi:hypothetical protein